MRERHFKISFLKIFSTHFMKWCNHNFTRLFVKILCCIISFLCYVILPHPFLILLLRLFLSCSLSLCVFSNHFIAQFSMFIQSYIKDTLTLCEVFCDTRIFSLSIFLFYCLACVKQVKKKETSERARPKTCILYNLLSTLDERCHIKNISEMFYN